MQNARKNIAQNNIHILGAGPCGLGAAATFQHAGMKGWNLYDPSASAGGLASTLRSPEGFLFDIGGHTIFSHYKHFDDMCSRVCKQWSSYQRATFVFMRERFIPYPLQRNFGLLPAAEARACLKGLLNAAPTRKAYTFEQWLRYQFGDGLYKLFLEPYNCKVWAHHPSTMTSQWVAERVATIDHEALHAIFRGEKDTTWGPNASFRYPTHGGVGAIWQGLAAELDSSRLHFQKWAVKIDARAQKIYFNDGSTAVYDQLISTMPLDQLCKIITGAGSWLAEAAESFVHSSTHIIGLGMEGACPPPLQDKDWLYFPEASVPFHRVTIPSNYSPYVVAHPGTQWSLMLEVSESPRKLVTNDVVKDTLESARRIGLIPPTSRVVSTLHRRFEYGYPTPFIGRDRLLEKMQPVLESYNIYSRGRFGGWKYEVSNHDHTYAQGVEIARRLLWNKPEVTYFHPEIINNSDTYNLARTRARIVR